MVLEYIILGHSENRKKVKQSLIKEKINQLLKSKIKCYFLYRRNIQRKKRGKTFSILRKQIKSSLEKKFNLNKIIFAYEPVWSIGTGKIPKTQWIKKNIQVY